MNSAFSKTISIFVGFVLGALSVAVVYSLAVVVIDLRIEQSARPTKNTNPPVPAGTVFTDKELEEGAKIAKEHFENYKRDYLKKASNEKADFWRPIKESAWLLFLLIVPALPMVRAKQKFILLGFALPVVSALFLFLT